MLLVLWKETPFFLSLSYIHTHSGLIDILSLADWFCSFPSLSPSSPLSRPLPLFNNLFIPSYSSLSSVAFPFHSAPWSSGAPRWPRRDGAEWRSSFRQWLKLPDMGERSQGTPTRTAWAFRTARAPWTSRFVSVCKRERQRERQRESVTLCRSGCVSVTSLTYTVLA